MKQHSLQQFTKDLSGIDCADLLSCWQWKTADLKEVVVITCFGDVFFLDQHNHIYWLRTDIGELEKAAESLEQFHQFIHDEQKVDNWFLPMLIEKLQAAGKTLKENEVYSYKQLPVIGGDYTVANIEPTDMGVHFAISGQICEQIKDMPEGTKVRISVKE